MSVNAALARCRSDGGRLAILAWRVEMENKICSTLAHAPLPASDLAA